MAEERSSAKKPQQKQSLPPINFSPSVRSHDILFYRGSEESGWIPRSACDRFTNVHAAVPVSQLFFALFADGGPINAMLVHAGILKQAYSFFSHKWSARTLVALLNFLMWFGNTTILLMAGMMGIDPSLYEAAEVDGATSSLIFRRITLPLLRPILIYVMITSLIGGMQMFDVPQILTNETGDPMRSTMTLIMYLNKHLFSKNYGMGGALSVFLFVITGLLSLIAFSIFPVIIVYILLSRFIVSGVALGGVKG